MTFRGRETIMAGQTLSDNHRRVLSVVARNIERSLGDIEELLIRKGAEHSRLHRIESSYSDGQRMGILRKVVEVRHRLAVFVRDFELTGESRSEQQIVDTKVTHMWMLLEDSFSQKLKGYGNVEKSISGKLDDSVSELLKLVRELQRLK